MALNAWQVGPGTDEGAGFGHPVDIVRKWSMGTGRGHDLVGHREAVAQEMHGLEGREPMTVCTWNGGTHADKRIKVGVEEVGTTATPCTLAGCIGEASKRVTP